jgi:hypothetical protein
MKLVRAGSVKEASVITVYPFSQIEDSLRLMQSGKHIGKIVLEPREADLVQVNILHHNDRIPHLQNFRSCQNLQVLSPSQAMPRISLPVALVG